jgi:hypothetical protein
MSASLSIVKNICINPISMNQEKQMSSYYQGHHNPATPTAFSDWVFRSKHRSRLPGVQNRLQGGTEAHKHIDLMIRSGHLKEFMPGDPGHDYEVIYCDDTTSDVEPLKASSLKVSGVPLTCKPDLVFRHKSLGTVVVIERKTTERHRDDLPKNLHELWDNVRCQLWCYGEIDDWAGAKEVRLAVNYWAIIGGEYRLTPYPIWWIRGDTSHLETRCQKLFRDYQESQRTYRAR